MESPMRNDISSIHLFAYGVSACSYHLVIAQTTKAVKSDDIAYTSPSTAENQNVSEKQYANAPMAPLPQINIVWLRLHSPFSAGFPSSLLAKKTMVR